MADGFAGARALKKGPSAQLPPKCFTGCSTEGWVALTSFRCFHLRHSVVPSALQRHKEDPLERISIDLDDDMTIGALRRLAQAMGRHLSIAFVDGVDRRPTRPGPRPASASSAISGELSSRRGGQSRRRKLSPEGRAALARNLEKARAARSANLKKKAATRT